MVKLNIVIVNYFSEKLVMECIESINDSIYDDYQITIVDNGSKSNEFTNLSSDKIILITNSSNHGFGHACNTGAANFNGEYILFLNPDTKIFKNTLTESIKFMDENRNIVALGCMQVDNDNNIHKTCARFVTLGNYFNKILYLNKISSNKWKSYRMLEFDHKSSQKVEHIMGSFYFMRNATFKQLNGFDTDFFVYYEDLELSKRIAKIKKEIYYNSDIKIYHETGGTSKNIKAIRLFYSLDALIIYTQKHLSPLHSIIIRTSILFLEPILRLTKSILSLNKIETQNIFKTYKMLYKKRLFN